MRCSTLSGSIAVMLLVATTQPLTAGENESKSTLPSIADRYRDAAKKIITATLNGNDAWKKMEMLCDGIGHRISGSKQLEEAIRWAHQQMRDDGMTNVHFERVLVPKWVRGEESATLLEPRIDKLAMLGLGMSVGTPDEGVTGEVVVVENEDEFEAKKEHVRDRIVLFNNSMPPYTPEGGSHYGSTVRFRGKGPVMAAKAGAIAVLVRSVTANSLRTPHTGATRYEDGVTKIPAAAISTEDADMIARLRARGERVVVNLRMDAKTLADVDSANVLAELVGREKPDEYVVIGGHIDSWDAGQGAHDDAAGCVMAMEAVNVLKKLDMIPRRTIRVVLWTNEENGLRGGKTYAENHASEMDNHIVAIESDSGAFKPQGYSIDCENESREKIAQEQMQEIVSLLEPIGPMKATIGGSGADISPMKKHGVLLMGHQVDGSIYFDYHHTHADTLDKVDPQELSENVATMAVVAYVIADMEERFGGPPTKKEVMSNGE